MSTRDRKSTLTAAQARQLRTNAGLSPQDWADFLHCSLQSVHNMESPKGATAIGRQMAALMIYMAHAPLRLHVDEAQDHAEALLREVPKDTP